MEYSELYSNNVDADGWTDTLNPMYLYNVFLPKAIVGKLFNVQRKLGLEKW